MTDIDPFPVHPGEPMIDPGPYPTEFLRRLRAWPVSSWRHGNRASVARSLLDTLAGLASGADRQPRPAVPDAGAHALPDQVQVLLGDALGAGVDRGRLDAVLKDAAAELGLRIR